MTVQDQAEVKRVAIIGGGSSGLIATKSAIEMLPTTGAKRYDVVCYEQSGSIKGCWGDPYPGFVSTSTRYTTQFACYPICDARVKADGGNSRAEFFRDGEYGEYLESFADHFQLRAHIQLNHRVERVARSDGGGWTLSIVSTDREEVRFVESFDIVVVCTGLAARPKPLESDVPRLSASDLNGCGGCSDIRNQTVVVIGGGESAVDYAHRLADPRLANQVYLSLHSGVRVSPRYHPVRGVPSDFLRNRLMLSIHPDIRNRLGQQFVEWRIKYQNWFERLFPASNRRSDTSSVPDVDKVKSEWALRLTKAAKANLFDMFHNKSDDFLDAVGDGRIQIVGRATDASFSSFYSFGSVSDKMGEVVNVLPHPDFVVPAVGYESTLGHLFEDKLSLQDFYCGCCHQRHRDLFLIGFARPVIGNIPTISEMQANYVFGLISGKLNRPTNVEEETQFQRSERRSRFGELNLDAVYPVEMFPYCDDLARISGLKVAPSFIDSPVQWCRTQLVPATTLEYFRHHADVREIVTKSPVYMPPLLILLLLLIKPFDLAYRYLQR